MTNQNILIGIDLGTTNSEIAINNDNNIEIIERAGGVKFVPSVFGYDKSKNKVVGQKAYQNLYLGQEEDFKNYRAEVKRIMGTSETIYFDRADINLTPEEISAEILKSLKEDVLKKYPDFNATSAVITVPAAFSSIQSEATKRAGNLAGFDHVVLLQEPIAAAVAYGFGNSKNEKWIVYDFGGGTFDVALVSLKDGNLSVLANNGDNFLGGKNIDLEIVDKIIVPKVVDNFSLSNFNRDNKKYQSIFAKLKYHAENAKIDLSQNNTTLIELGTTPYNNIGKDDSGKEIEISFDFDRKELESILEPLVDRTVKLTKETLKEAGIKSTAVQKIILVGGPTQIPYLQKRLEHDLKISVDSSNDPLTVVARGACIFAISQKLPKKVVDKSSKDKAKGEYSINLNYESLTSETDEIVVGVIDSLKDSEDEYYIQIQSESGTYNGSKNKIKNGKFLETVVLEPNRLNRYWIYLIDGNGNTVTVTPDSFDIVHGISVSDAPLPHTIGIVLSKKESANNFVSTNIREVIWEKNLPLSDLKFQGSYKTARKLKRNDQNPLDIIIDEGESEIPDNNAFICEVGIESKNLPYDLPEGTEVEITVELNKSRELTVDVYIPLIDLTLNGRSTIMDQMIDITNLEVELEIQSKKINDVLDNCSPEEKKELEYSIHSVKKSVQNARTDEDEKRKANKQLKDLKIMIGKLQKDKELPQLIKEFNDGIENAQKVIDEYGTEEDKDKNSIELSKVKSEGDDAIKDKDKILLQRVNEQIQEISMRALLSNPETWRYYFQRLVSENHNFINEKESQYYFDKGRRAIEQGNQDELKHCVQSLWSLLPEAEQVANKAITSGITK